MGLLNWLFGKDISPKKELKKKGFDFTKEDFLKAITKDDNHSVILFLKAGKNPNIRGYRGATALMYATGEGRISISQILLDHGASINLEDEDCMTALSYAAANGHTELVELLVKKGAHINYKAGDGMTALMWAAVKGHGETVKILLKNSADIHIKKRRADVDGTALGMAAIANHPFVVDILLHHGARVNKYTLEEVEQEGKTEIASKLRRAL